VTGVQTCALPILLIKINAETRRVEGFVLRDMDGNWVDHTLRTHALGKPALRVSGDLKKDAELLRYAYATENMAESYLEMWRGRSVESIFKYFLPREELTRVLQEADRLYLRSFRKAFPGAKLRGLSKLPEALQKLQARFATAEEQRVYGELRARFAKAGPPLAVRAGKWLQQRTRIEVARPTNDLQRWRDDSRHRLRRLAPPHHDARRHPRPHR
jgi:hypothetical protein